MLCAVRGWWPAGGAVRCGSQSRMRGSGVRVGRSRIGCGGGRGGGGGGGTGGEGLDAAAVTGFLLGEAGRGLSPGSLRGRVAELRSLLRFLYLAGVTGCPLAAAVPPVPGWKDTAVPARVAPEQARALLDCCDRQAAAGMRAPPMPLLMAP